MTKQIRLRQHDNGELSVRFYKTSSLFGKYKIYSIRRGSPSETRLQYVLNKEFNLTNQFYNLYVKSDEGVTYQLYYWLKRLS